MYSLYCDIYFIVVICNRTCKYLWMYLDLFFLLIPSLWIYQGLLRWLSGKESACQCKELWVRSLDQKDPLEEEVATHSSILAWRIPWTEKSGRLQSMGSQRVAYDWTTNTQTHTHIMKKRLNKLSIEDMYLNIIKTIMTSPQLILMLFIRSVMSLCDPMTIAHQASLSFTISWSLLKVMFIESVMSSNDTILCHALFLLPLLFPSIRVFFNESDLISGGQGFGASASASVLPMNIQGWFPLELAGLIFL